MEIIVTVLVLILVFMLINITPKITETQKTLLTIVAIVLSLFLILGKGYFIR